MRQTKIVVTIGPSVDSKAQLNDFIQQGVNVFRVNFSHGDSQAIQRNVQLIRELEADHKRPIGILADLQGPKVRIGQMAPLSLKSGMRLRLTTKTNVPQDHLFVDYPNFMAEVKVDQTLLIDDGLIQCRVIDKTDDYVEVESLSDEILKPRKGINLMGGGLMAESLTAKDHHDLEIAVKMGVDFIALSFVKSPADVKTLKGHLERYQSNAKIIAKIECKAALPVMDQIVQVADGIMVARGDLALEVGNEQVPVIQKQLIQMAKQHHKPIIIATQMMESMIHHKRPTRAEVSDVANAVMDGADAVMLSAETAVGKFPQEAVAEMRRVCLAAEQSLGVHPLAFQDSALSRVDEAVVTSTMVCAQQLAAKAIVVLTESGDTPRYMAGYDTRVPVLALSEHSATLRHMCLLRNVQPIYCNLSELSEPIHQQVIAQLTRQKHLSSGDVIILTRGYAIGVVGQTNSMAIWKVDA
jgi:pyruvate kinase